MSWFVNLRLQWKLLGIQLAVCSVTLVVGLLGYWGIQQATHDLDALGGSLVPKVVALGRMHQSRYETVADLRGAILASDPKSITNFVDLARGAAHQTDVALAEYAALPLSADERRALSEYRAEHANWLKATEQTLLAIGTAPRGSVIELIDKTVTPSTARLDAIADDLRQRTEQQTADAQAAVAVADGRARWTTLQLLIAVVIGSVLAVGAGRLVVRGITRRAEAVEQMVTSLADDCATSLAEALEAMANNDLSVHVESTTLPLPDLGKDELGQTAAATNRLRDMLDATIVSYGRARAGLQDVVGQIQAAASNVAASSDQLELVGDHTRAAVQQVTVAVQNVATGAQDASRSAQDTNAAVSQLNQAIEGIASGANYQAQQVQAASTTATQMAAGVEQVAANAQNVAAASQHSKASAEHGAQAVRETVAGMAEIKTVVAEAASKAQELSKLGERIGAVVETIDDIAEQTNLLALNAAIEAARAGEHGRGFAVVADEVRKLAERSSRETKQIAALIKDVQAATQQAVGAMESGAHKVDRGTERADLAGRALSDILAAVDNSVQQVTEIAASAREMATASRSVVEAMTSMGAVVEENTAATEEMASQASLVSSAVASIASVSVEQSASTEEVSASTEEMSAQVDEMSAQARGLASTAQQLSSLVSRFRLAAAEAPLQSARITPLRRAA